MAVGEDLTPNSGAERGGQGRASPNSTRTGCFPASMAGQKRLGVRTEGSKKEGCAERIAPMSTLSQNGYGIYNTSDMGQARGRY